MVKVLVGYSVRISAHLLFKTMILIIFLLRLDALALEHYNTVILLLLTGLLNERN
jgi:hypothetical protein